MGRPRLPGPAPVAAARLRRLARLSPPALTPPNAELADGNVELAGGIGESHALAREFCIRAARYTAQFYDEESGRPSPRSGYGTATNGERTPACEFNASNRTVPASPITKATRNDNR
ncbi:hypothetical protein GCM10027445_62980 [Amycolatopsis endophytica]